MNYDEILEEILKIKNLIDTLEDNILDDIDDWWDIPKRETFHIIVDRLNFINEKLIDCKNYVNELLCEESYTDEEDTDETNSTKRT